MKSKYLLLLAIPIMCLLAMSCSSDTDNEGNGEDGNAVTLTYAPKKVAMSARQAESVEITNQFSLSCFKSVSESKDFVGKSVVTSPLSAAFVSAILLNGADGETASEVAKAYGLDAADGDAVGAINDMAKKLVEELPTLDEYTSFSLSNLVSNRRKDQLNSSFASTIEECFSAKVEENDQTAARDSIFNLIKQLKTEDSKESLVKASQLQYSMSKLDFIVMNMIQFESKWLLPFDKTRTTVEAFSLEDGTLKNVMMMKQFASFGYNDNDVYQTLRMYYGNGSYSMLVMLPHEGKNVDDVVSSLTPSAWKENVAGLQTQDVDVKFPRFSSNTAFDLNNVLAPLGIKSIFESTANLSKMYDAWNGYEYGDKLLLLQAVTIDVDEGGTKANAKTTTENWYPAYITSVPPEFYADHPFVYAIVENSTGAICFMGKYMGN